MTRQTGLALLAMFLSACTDQVSGAADAAMPVADLAVDKAAACASTFGTTLTAPYGRLDGTVRAVVPANQPGCAMTTSPTHLLIEVDAGGATYRMVLNIESDRADDPRVRLATLDAPLVGPAFGDGWRTPVTVDYVANLGLHQDQFTPHPKAELIQLVTDALTLGAPISVYASTDGGNSAHLIHRNANAQDGAIVIHPNSSPRWLLFAFSTQSF